MDNLTKFDRYYLAIKANRWYRYFYIFCRLSLAFAFIAAGLVKIFGERFASGLSIKHPMGAYLEALHHTGYYYTLIGIGQVIAAVLLIIPRTVTLGSLLYLPIIVNIWLLSMALRFEGSILTSPLMVLANLYILMWNYDRLKYILPFKHFPNYGIIQQPEKYSSRFPFLFFGFVIGAVILIAAIFQFGYSVMPRNSMKDCKSQFINTKNEVAGLKFCDCIHNSGAALNICMEEFERETKGK